MTKLTLTPEARTMLRDLYTKADELAQLPVKKMTKEETWAFLKAAPVRTVRLTGMTDAEVWADMNKWNGTNHPLPDDRFCSICKRKLDQPDDPKSIDCGGDCWGCMEEFEKPDDGA